MTKPLRSIIVDDERLARSQLRRMLEQCPGNQVIGEAEDVQGAVAIIGDLRPDLVFLDIQLAGESGFSVLERIDPAIQVAFVTAYDAFAIRAFEVNALDYLLKPVRMARLKKTIRRIQTGARPSKEGGALACEDHILAESGHRKHFLKVQHIVCIVAETPYARILTEDGQSVMILKSLADWEKRLPPKSFVRVHRSTIVNVAHIERIEKSANYSYQVFMKNLAEPLSMSRRYARQLKTLF
ncbi:Response regulator transcription factor [Sulfidibacter corallicola]|uniref:Response regulator transcription factor n=1 Tax=Sulfidibacter corallicola TaxID=2818388 RepID=A0A8A4TG13_SULCO|nr:LytTR family DNA-binding domain-containing protein [Sulfidibacter corallicola]QTD48467.1 response regulator transcription factor [Sulfidibacter corallicola]